MLERLNADTLFKKPETRPKEPQPPKLPVQKIPKEQTWVIRRKMPRIPNDGKQRR